MARGKRRERLVHNEWFKWSHVTGQLSYKPPRACRWLLVCVHEQKGVGKGREDVRELRGLTSRELLTISLFKLHLPLPALFQLTCTVYLV